MIRKIMKAAKQPKIIPGEMSDMDIDLISLVRKGANGQKIQIYKADDSEEPDGDEEAQGLLEVLKSYFSNKGKVQKADDAVKKTSKKTFSSMMAVNDITENMWRANDTLRSVMRDIISNEEITDKKAALLQAVDEYSAYMKDKVNVSTIAKSAAFFDVPDSVIEKSGKKVSSKNLTALRDAQKALSAVIEEAEGPKNPEDNPDEEKNKEGNEKPDGKKEDGEVKKEELTNVMKEALEDILKPITERLDKIEKSDTDETAEEEAADGNIAEVVKSAISEAVKPINERLEKIEKSRALPRSKEGDEPNQVQKSETGIFDGFFTK